MQVLDSENFRISQAKVCEYFCSFLILILEQNFCSKNLHSDELKYFVNFLFGRMVILTSFRPIFVIFISVFCFTGRSDNKSFVTNKIHLE